MLQVFNLSRYCSVLFLETKTDIYHKDTDTFNLVINVIAKKTFISIWQDAFVPQSQTTLVNVRVHKQQIAQKEFRMLDMSKHILICGRNKTPDFFITGFLKVKKESDDLGKIMKEHFIKKYKPKLNNLSLLI